MAREKKTILAGRELQRVLASIGAGRSQNVMGAVFEELRVPLYDLAMGMATDDDELIDEAMRDLGGAEGEIAP